MRTRGGAGCRLRQASEAWMGGRRVTGGGVKRVASAPVFGSCASRSASWATKSSISSTCPWYAAQCTGVACHWPERAVFAPHSSSTRAAATWPRIATRWSGRSSFSQHGSMPPSTSAPEVRRRERPMASPRRAQSKTAGLFSSYCAQEMSSASRHEAARDDAGFVARAGSGRGSRPAPTRATPWRCPAARAARCGWA